MATDSKELGKPDDESILIVDGKADSAPLASFYGLLKSSGNYLSSAGDGISSTSRQVVERASKQVTKASDLACDAYRGAVASTDGLKTKAIKGGKAALAGAGVAVLSGVAVKGLKKAASTKGLEILKPLGKGNVAAHVVEATVTVGQQGYKLYRGETTKAEMAHACAEKGSGMLASAGGAGLGAMAAVALSLPTGGASLVVGGASMLAGMAGPKVYQAGRKMVGDLMDKRASDAIQQNDEQAPTETERS